MNEPRESIYELLRQRADVQAQLNLLPFTGTPEVRERDNKRYLYVKNRTGNKTVSTYVGLYSDDLYNLLLRNAREAKTLRKQLRTISRQLAQLGFSDSGLAPSVVLNLDYARAHVKTAIYDQAVLEGIATTFPQTETIIDGGIVNGMTAQDIQKVLNLKHAWQFVLDTDVIQAPSDYALLSYIASMINEGIMFNGGRIRELPVTIGGTSYIPPIPQEQDVRDRLAELSRAEENPVDAALTMCLYIMRTQIFLDGNKRAAFIFANHFLISHAAGFCVVPVVYVDEFKELLIRFYETGSQDKLKSFLRRVAVTKMENDR